MQQRLALMLAVIALALPARGQQASPPGSPAPAKPTPLVGVRPTPAGDEKLEIYQIDLDPTGTAFALNKPVLDGDAYVFKNWPERQTVRLSQTKIKKITQRTKDLNQEVVYRIDLVPSGRMIAREEPKLKGTSYTFHTWRDGTLMSLRKADVKQVVRVVGLPAFRIQQEERGAALMGNLPMEGGTATILPGAPAPAPAAGTASTAGQGNWSYQGQPGVTDAYAPPSAVVSSPGDVPKAAPAPTPPPH